MLLIFLNINFTCSQTHNFSQVIKFRIISVSPEDDHEVVHNYYKHSLSTIVSSVFESEPQKLKSLCTFDYNLVQENNEFSYNCTELCNRVYQE